VASETAALDIVGAAFVREVEPGEFLAINEDGIRSQMWATPDPKGCIFEYVYLARPDTTIAGQGVHATRVEIGKSLAIEAPVDADLVIPVPESGTPAAIGYAQQSGIPYGLGLVKNSYVGRTFIQPSQTIRQLGIRLKLNPLREITQLFAVTRNAQLCACYVKQERAKSTCEFLAHRLNGPAITVSILLRALS
jgi:amidophosphoribosyltransferase